MLNVRNRFGDNTTVGAILIFLALAGEVYGETLNSCLDAEVARGSEAGTATFIGDSWEHMWSNQSTTHVPGQDLEMNFGDGDIVRWRNGNQEPGAWADNLSTLKRSLGDGPFTAVRLRVDSIIVINDECEQSWQLIQNHPTTPVATDGTIIDEHEYECLAKSGILMFEKVETDENGLTYADPVRQTGGFFLSFGPGQYVVGVDTWGDQSYFRTDDGVCGSSS